mmetsp:Transcript_20684/g.66922  ORF Transcript_20684/g.66922 Transcript_20684/m.66922 type:complete len:283 (+) Transcript_20684:460-1308(+)
MAGTGLRAAQPSANPMVPPASLHGPPHRSRRQHVGPRRRHHRAVQPVRCAQGAPALPAHAAVLSRPPQRVRRSQHWLHVLQQLLRRRQGAVDRARDGAARAELLLSERGRHVRRHRPLLQGDGPVGSHGAAAPAQALDICAGPKGHVRRPRLVLLRTPHLQEADPIQLPAARRHGLRKGLLRLGWVQSPGRRLGWRPYRPLCAAPASWCAARRAGAAAGDDGHRARRRALLVAWHRRGRGRRLVGRVARPAEARLRPLCGGRCLGHQSGADAGARHVALRGG